MTSKYELASSRDYSRAKHDNTPARHRLTLIMEFFQNLHDNCQALPLALPYNYMIRTRHRNGLLHKHYSCPDVSKNGILHKGRCRTLNTQCRYHDCLQNSNKCELAFYC